MSSESRDEMLIALEAEVSKAESKLRSAEISLEDIDRKLKSNEDNFQRKLQEKAIGYKEQTGADFVREVDAAGKTTYKFSRETDTKEQKKRRQLVIRRQFDSENGTYSLKPRFVNEPENAVKDVNSVKDFKKPKDRKRFIATKIMGHYGKIEISTEVNNPFLNVVGKPIIVPVQAAVKLTEKIGSAVSKAANSPVGKGIKTAEKIVTAPVIIPARIIKDISDKGGIIHSVVDLGDRIKIEGFNAPKPIKVIGNIAKSTALGAETAINTASEGVKNFSIEIAKEKIYEEMNRSISDNEASKAAYVIGMKTIEIYRILDEHTKFKRAVKRDKAGNDVADIGVARYLAEKSEKKFIRKQDDLTEQKRYAELKTDEVRSEYELAKKRLEQYKAHGNIGNVTADIPQPETTEIADKNSPTAKMDKKIQNTKRKLRSVKKHTYKVKFRKVVTTDKNGISRMRRRPVLQREFISAEKPATAWNTAKKLDGLAVGTATQSLRRKAMRDGGDNSGIEAGNFAITAAQQSDRFIKSVDEKERRYLEKKLETKLDKLENQKKLLTESEANKPKAKEVQENNKRKSKKFGIKANKANQKNNIKKKHHRKAHSNYVQKSRQAAKELLTDILREIGGRSRSILILILPLIAVVGISFTFVMCGMPMVENRS